MFRTLDARRERWVEKLISRYCYIVYEDLFKKSKVLFLGEICGSRCFSRKNRKRQNKVNFEIERTKVRLTFESRGRLISSNPNPWLFSVDQFFSNRKLKKRTKFTKKKLSSRVEMSLIVKWFNSILFKRRIFLYGKKEKKRNVSKVAHGLLINYE